MSKGWYMQHRRDHFFRTAKKEGYRARSAYKLMQINKRFRLLKQGDAVVDLGAAPGGWSQVLVELVGPGGVFGVDLQRIAPIEGAVMIQGDFTKKSTHERLWAKLEEAHFGELDAVVSDMAPEMSGNYDLDQVRSVHLCGMAVRFAEAHLKHGGIFICKIFEGADFVEFRDALRTRFRKLDQYHPPASRKSSSEVYIIGKGFRGGKSSTDEDE